MLVLVLLVVLLVLLVVVLVVVVGSGGALRRDEDGSPRPHYVAVQLWLLRLLVLVLVSLLVVVVVVVLLLLLLAVAVVLVLVLVLVCVDTGGWGESVAAMSLLRHCSQLTATAAGCRVHQRGGTDRTIHRRLGRVSPHRCSSSLHWNGRPPAIPPPPPIRGQSPPAKTPAKHRSRILDARVIWRLLPSPPSSPFERASPSSASERLCAKTA